MLLEQWAYDPAVLAKISGHYEAEEGGRSSPLPPALVSSLVATKHVMEGVNWTRFIGMALFDLLAHSAAPPYQYQGQAGLSLKQLFDAVMQDVTGRDGASLGEGAHYAASWYHLCTGYDAGYYSYLWSEVFAVDCFTAFQQQPSSASSSSSSSSSSRGGGGRGCFDESVGRRYRNAILNPGGDL